MSQLSVDPHLSFGFHLLQLARRWRRFDEQVMARNGYTDVSWVPLLHLYGHGPVMQKELAMRCGVDTSSLVRLLNPLTEKGLIDRRQHPEDRRAWLLELTETGNQEAARIAGVVGQAESEMALGLPKHLNDAFIKAAKLINANLDDLERAGA